MSIALPTSLACDQDRAVQLLHAYYGQPFSGTGTRSGAAFDLWDSTGTREQDADVFTADDLVAVSLLAVQVPGPAARVLLVEKRQSSPSFSHGWGRIETWRQCGNRSTMTVRNGP